MNGNHDRIALLKFVTDFRIGGTERQVANLATNLDRDRFELHVACFRQIGEHLGEIRASGARVTDFVVKSLVRPSALQQQARLACYLRTNRIRIVHTWGFYPNVFAILAARLAGVRPIIASIRDTGDHLTPSRRRVQRWVCRMADRVLVNAVAVRERLLSEGCAPEKLTVIPNGIDLRRFSRPGDRRLRDELGLPDSAPVVAVVARFNALKGIEYFLEAARIVGQSFPETRFLLVGDGAKNDQANGCYRERLERLAASLGLARRAVFAGSRSDVPELLAGVTVSVLPSLTEGLSNTILESLAASVPVVATNVGGNPEIVEDGSTGLLVPPRDAAALAGAVGALLSDPARATRMGEAGRRSVEARFSLEAMVRETERLYESLLKDAWSGRHARAGRYHGDRVRGSDFAPAVRDRLRPTAPTPLSVEILDDAEVFGTLREEWNALLTESAADTIFLTWEWLHTWWKHLSGYRRLAILAARRGSELVGVAPLALRRGLGPLLPPRISFLGSGTVGSDYLDVVAKKGSEQEVLEALADQLGRLGAALELQGVRAEGGAADKLADALEGRGFKAFHAQAETCPFIPLARRSWDEYLGSLGREHRYNFKRRLRKLQESDLRFERISTEERRGEAIAILFDLHDRRWKERGGSDAFSSREVLSFHEEVSRLALERGWLRLFILWVAGQPAAALYGFRYRETFFFYQSGFDPLFARKSVGLVTMGLTIKSALEEGAEEFDLLHGDEAYKSLWARNRRDLMRLEVDPPGARALLRRGAIETERAARRVARRIFPAPVVGRLAAWLGGVLYN